MKKRLNVGWRWPRQSLTSNPGQSRNVSANLGVTAGNSRNHFRSKKGLDHHYWLIEFNNRRKSSISQKTIKSVVATTVQEALILCKDASDEESIDLPQILHKPTTKRITATTMAVSIYTYLFISELSEISEYYMKVRSHNGDVDGKDWTRSGLSIHSS